MRNQTPGPIRGSFLTGKTPDSVFCSLQVKKKKMIVTLIIIGFVFSSVTTQLLIQLNKIITRVTSL